MFPFLSDHSSDSNVCSIAYGVIAGIMSYMLLNGITLALRKISGGRIVPHDLDNAEEWVIPPGGIVPAWVYVPSSPDFKYVWFMLTFFFFLGLIGKSL